MSFKFKFLGFCVCEFITCLFLDFMICRFEPLWTSWLRDTWQINQVWNLDVTDDRLAVNLELFHSRCREVCPSWFLSSHDILVVRNTRRWHQSNSLQSPTRMLYRDWRETALVRISQYDSDRWASYNFSQHLVVLCDFKCILFWIIIKVPFAISNAFCLELWLKYHFLDGKSLLHIESWVLCNVIDMLIMMIGIFPIKESNYL